MKHTDKFYMAAAKSKKTGKVVYLVNPSIFDENWGIDFWDEDIENASIFPSERDVLLGVKASWGNDKVTDFNILEYDMTPSRVIPLPGSLK